MPSPENLARAMWLADGYRRELWDDEQRDVSWRSHMFYEKRKYVAKAESILYILNEND